MKHLKPTRALVALRTCLIGFALGLASPSFAGQNCEEKPQTPSNIRNAFSLGAKSFKELNESDAQVALVARVGSDLSKYGIRFSHLGIAWRDNPKGKWLVTHELNRCGTAESSLYDEGLANFFADDMFAWESAALIPTPELQAKLVKILAVNGAFALHERKYNMVTYPFSVKYQNSNQWVLETIAMAASDRVYDRNSAQAWLKAQNYAPSTLKIGALTRLGGRMSKANIAFDDHPNERRYADLIDVVSVDSVFHFMQGKGWVQKFLNQNLNAEFGRWEASQ